MRKLVFMLAALVTTWAVPALYLDIRIPWLRTPVGVLYLCIVGAILWLTRARRKGILLWVGTLTLDLTGPFCTSPIETGRQKGMARCRRRHLRRSRS